ncbi:MAG: hypothetical protein ACRYGL_07170 [Janthinobacterium lividum]
MKRFAAAGIFSIAAIFAANAQAAGCMSGAAVGGVGGHFVGHHALLGAAGGCLIGHHMAKKRQRQAAMNAQPQVQPAPAPAQ